jgi:glycosyltransferase involved in cell wall biosynthesis
MTAPDLTSVPRHLPEPPAGKTGWPWTLPAWPDPALLAGQADWPRLTVVTPSYNQGAFLEETLRSVLLQGYPNLQYIVIDGGSTDNSVDIIRRYADHLDYWVSEKDRGQNHAINKGMARATGEVLAYLNSDDKYLPWTFRTAGRIFMTLPEVKWLTTQTNMEWNLAGDLISATHASHHTRSWFYRGLTLGYRKGRPANKSWIQQEATFWRRALWDQAGGRMAEDLYMAGDFELWARFYQHADLVTVDVPLAGWRRHATNKTVLDGYYKVAEDVLSKYPHEAEGVLAKYAHETTRPRAVTWLLQQVERWTGWGGRRFGSRLAWVDYCLRTGKWELHSKYVF